MGCKFEIDVNNLNEIFETGKVARQANGSVLYRSGDAVLLATVVADFDSPVDEPFVPMMVQYIEKTYAAGKFPSGFIKREAKPSDFETLTSRIIDRSIRPLFPEGYRYPTQITVMVLSSDSEVDLQVAALNAASAALYISDIPLNYPVCGVRFGRIDGEFVVNPKMSELKNNSALDLYVAGTKSDLLMIEMRTLGGEIIESIPTGVDPLIEPTLSSSTTSIHTSNALSENEFLEVIKLASTAIFEQTSAYESTFNVAQKEETNIEIVESSELDAIYTYIDELHKEDIEDAIAHMAKSERSNALKNIAKTILGSSVSEDENWNKDNIKESVEGYKKNVVRNMIINDNIRADGRGLKDVRPISIDMNILPSVHSSALFTRGETQALVTTTLGGDRDAQQFEMLSDSGSSHETFMVHYNFPGFSVGEPKPIGPPARRELGHGNLAKRALNAVIKDDSSQTIRLVSEILESNGSSSMATVCGGSLALEAAGIETTGLVAGVAMGLVMQDGKHAVLTDIMGLEDHDGDMDFKVAGPREGITAMQMDIKLGGIELNVLEDALLQAKEGREHILSLMEEAAKDIEPTSALPSTELFNVDPSSVVDIIGQAGKTIRGIIEEFGVAIDLDKKSGSVKVVGEKAKVTAACDQIRDIASKPSTKKSIKFEELYKANETYQGKAVRITDFGAFVELPEGGEGLLHISKLAKHRVNNVKDYVNEGDAIEVVVLKVDNKRIELALKSYIDG